MKYKYKISILSVAMASIMLVSMVAAAGVSAAAQPATVGAPVTGGPGACYDGTNYWLVAQGTPNSAGQNIYYKTANTEGGLSTAAWIPLGTGTNPTIVSLGTTGAVAVFARGTNGALWGKANDTGVSWSNVGLPSTSVAAGTGAVALYDTTTLQMDIFYVNSGSNSLMWLAGTSNAETTLTNLGGAVFATPAATSPVSGTITVVVEGTGGVIYERMYQMGAFGGWTKFHDGAIGLGASLVSGSPPTDGSAVLAPLRNVELYVAGTNGHLYELYSGDGGLTWYTPNPILHPGTLGWTNLGGVCKSAPSAVYDGTPYIFVTGGDGGIWANQAGTWSSTSITGP
jgi:hypothetical protein